MTDNQTILKGNPVTDNFLTIRSTKELTVGKDIVTINNRVFAVVPYSNPQEDTYLLCIARKELQP